LGEGECAAIALALQLDLPEVLLDDKLAIIYRLEGWIKVRINQLLRWIKGALKI